MKPLVVKADVQRHWWFVPAFAVALLLVWSRLLSQGSGQRLMRKGLIVRLSAL
jgi:hypothetical protein